MKVSSRTGWGCGGEAPCRVMKTGLLDRWRRRFRRYVLYKQLSDLQTEMSTFFAECTPNFWKAHLFLQKFQVILLYFCFYCIANRNTNVQNIIFSLNNNNFMYYCIKLKDVLLGVFTPLCCWHHPWPSVKHVHPCSVKLLHLQALRVASIWQVHGIRMCHSYIDVSHYALFSSSDLQQGAFSLARSDSSSTISYCKLVVSPGLAETLLSLHHLHLIRASSPTLTVWVIIIRVTNETINKVPGTQTAIINSSHVLFRSNLASAKNESFCKWKVYSGLHALVIKLCNDARKYKYVLTKLYSV